VRLLKDMDQATINSNTRTSDVYNDYNYLWNLIHNMGMEIPIVW